MNSPIPYTISIFMPAYNAASHILRVFKRIPRSLWDVIDTVVVVNDGSTDDTKAVIQQLQQEEERITAFHLSRNKGYGTAVQIGLRRCRESGCDYAVCLHADGQYPPEAILRCVQYMHTCTIDLLQGSRIASGMALRGGMPLYKYVAGKALTVLENSTFGLSMTDYHSGFLIYSRNALQRLPLARLSTSFDFDLEIIASCRACGLTIAEQPIAAQYRDEVSYLDPLRYGLRVLWSLVKYRCGYYHCIE